MASDSTKGGRLLKEAWLSGQASINRCIDLCQAHVALRAWEEHQQQHHGTRRLADAIQRTTTHTPPPSGSSFPGHGLGDQEHKQLQPDGDNPGHDGWVIDTIPNGVKCWHSPGDVASAPGLLCVRGDVTIEGKQHHKQHRTTPVSAEAVIPSAPPPPPFLSDSPYDHLGERDLPPSVGTVGAKDRASTPPPRMEIARSKNLPDNILHGGADALKEPSLEEEGRRRGVRTRSRTSYAERCEQKQLGPTSLNDTARLERGCEWDMDRASTYPHLPPPSVRSHRSSANIPLTLPLSPLAGSPHDHLDEHNQETVLDSPLDKGMMGPKDGTLIIPPCIKTSRLRDPSEELLYDCTDVQLEPRLEDGGRRRGMRTRAWVSRTEKHDGKQLKSTNSNGATRPREGSVRDTDTSSKCSHPLPPATRLHLDSNLYPPLVDDSTEGVVYARRRPRDICRTDGPPSLPPDHASRGREETYTRMKTRSQTRLHAERMNSIVDARGGGCINDGERSSTGQTSMCAQPHDFISQINSGSDHIVLPSPRTYSQQSDYLEKAKLNYDYTQTANQCETVTCKNSAPCAHIDSNCSGVGGFDESHTFPINIKTPVGRSRPLTRAYLRAQGGSHYKNLAS